MTWVKLDDSFPSNPKVVGLSGAAFRLHVSALCYCGQHLTDGEIPRMATRTMGYRPAAIAQLVKAGLWDATDSGWSIHGFLDYNPTRIEVEERRLSRSEAGRKGGQISKRLSKRQASAYGLLQQENNPVPSRPVPNPNTTALESDSQPEPAESGGGVMDQAAQLLALAEATRRGAQIGNRAGYVRTRIPALLKEWAPTWSALLERAPTMTAQQLADSLLKPVQSQTVGRDSSPVVKSVAKDRSCPKCEGVGVVEGAAGFEDCSCKRLKVV